MDIYPIGGGICHFIMVLFHKFIISQVISDLHENIIKFDDME